MTTHCIPADPETTRVGNAYGHRRLIGVRSIWAHRAAWEAVHGPIPEGAIVRHACDNPECVNVDHLSLGTVADNQRDMADRGRGRNQNTGVTQCKNGHDLAGDNLYEWTGGDGVTHRRCKSCLNTAKRERRAASRLVGVE